MLSHPVLCHICKSMCLFKTQVKYSSAFLGYLWNFFLNVVCKLEYENFNICWRILVWLILVVLGMIYKWPRKGQHSLPDSPTCQALKLFSVFFILLKILHYSESPNIYFFLTTEETDTLLGKLSSFLNKEFQDWREYQRIVHVAERAVLKKITVSCMFILHYHIYGYACWQICVCVFVNIFRSSSLPAVMV